MAVPVPQFPFQEDVAYLTAWDGTKIQVLKEVEIVPPGGGDPVKVLVYDEAATNAAYATYIQNHPVPTTTGPNFSTAPIAPDEAPEDPEGDEETDPEEAEPEA